MHSEDPRAESVKRKIDIQDHLCTVSCKSECKTSGEENKSETVIKKNLINWQKLNWLRPRLFQKYNKNDSSPSYVPADAGSSLTRKVVIMDSKSFAHEIHNFFDYQEEGTEVINKKKNNWQKLKLPYHFITKNNGKNGSPYKQIEEPGNNRKGKTVKKYSETLIFGLHEVLLRYEREANNQKKKKWAKLKLPSQISRRRKREKVSTNGKTKVTVNKCRRKMTKINSEALSLDFQKYSPPYEDDLRLEDLETEPEDTEWDIQDDDSVEIHTINEKQQRNMKIENRWAKNKTSFSSSSKE